MPTHAESLQFIEDLIAAYNEAGGIVYTLADLSGGHISDMGVIARLSAVSRHPSHGGGATFGGDYRTEMYVSLYERMAHPGDNGVPANSLEAALMELEVRVPGITADVNWSEVIGQEVSGR